jgi:hypothetical protein
MLSTMACKIGTNNEKQKRVIFGHDDGEAVGTEFNVLSL